MVTKTIQRIYIKDEKGNGGETKLIITEPKTKNATRIVPLSREFLYFLRKMRKDEDIYIYCLAKRFRWNLEVLEDIIIGYLIS